MIVYEYSTLKVNVADLESSLTEYSKAGWEIINILPSVYSSMNNPFTELLQLLIVLRNPISDTTGEAC